MANANLNFESFAQDAHKYVNELAHELGHPEEKNRVLIIWRSVMHTLRDRIHLGESFQIIDPLPMIFKGIYVQNWKYSEKPPLQYETMEEMNNQVKDLQAHYGEQDFSWSKSTEEIISITLNSLKRFISKGQMGHIIGQMPKEIKEYLSEQVQ
ncbi:MAG: DUF2267 domain-containing protein [Bacteroidota bacterium]